MRTGLAEVIVPVGRGAPRTVAERATSVSDLGDGTTSPMPMRQRGPVGRQRAMSRLPDSTIARAKLGDDAAFAEIVRHYYPRCLRFARNMLGDITDAEDAVQEAFLRVHGALPRYTEYGRFEAWLFRILANQCRTIRARERRRGEWLTSYEPRHDAAAPEAPDETGGLLRREIERALRELPALLREAFLLYHVEGMDYEQMMAVTGARTSALKMRVKRARDILRARLQEVGSG